MNKRRLLKLADLLEADAKNKKGIKFDLGSWGFSKQKKPTVSCGTTACAMGLAALSGAFKHQGLRAIFDEITPGHTDIDVTMPGKKAGLYAAMRLFDLNYYEAEWLFTPVAYQTAEGRDAERAVARRIRDFVAETMMP